MTMIFITHQIPGLQVDEVFSFDGDHQHTTKVEVVGEERQWSHLFRVNDENVPIDTTRWRITA